MEIIVGTAGHIDHGKTALVRALTGTDADRLPEEKARGITIDIGFAELFTENMHFGFVDVPGHERFVKNMLAGASGIDLVLLVIAADEGLMPQTREHFEICRLLGLTSGIVVLTKSDLVDKETLELARMDAAELVADSFLENAPLIAVSSVTGSGIDALKSALEAQACTLPARSNDRIAFLPIDRSFAVKGFGAVVTGTLASGEITEGGEMELLPNARRLRVRGLQTYGKAVKKALAGRRTAVNLAGIDHGELIRGMILSEPGMLRPTQIVDTEIELLGDVNRPLRTRQRVRVHIGTAEVLARVAVLNEHGEIKPGESGFVQLRLESPVACMMGERFIIRSYSPQRTIGGGEILGPLAEKHRRKDIGLAVALLQSLSSVGDDKEEIVRIITTAKGIAGISISGICSRTGWRESVANDAGRAAIDSKAIVSAGDMLIAADAFSELVARAVKAIAEFHKREPLASGMPRETLREREFRYVPAEIFAAVLGRLEDEGKIVSERETIRLAGHHTELSADERAFVERLLNLYDGARFEPPKHESAISAAVGSLGTANARTLFQMSVKEGKIIKVTEEFYFSANAIEDLRLSIRKYADTTSDRLIDVAKFKEIAGVSRKYAIPLLEYFDRERVTVRKGDKRIVLK